MRLTAETSFSSNLNLVRLLPCHVLLLKQSLDNESTVHILCKETNKMKNYNQLSSLFNKPEANVEIYSALHITHD